jgi:lipopolysaccharide/colanic/teichoic acid biosynthesis glycosyltransferase
MKLTSVFSSIQEYFRFKPQFRKKLPPVFSQAEIDEFVKAFDDYRQKAIKNNTLCIPDKTLNPKVQRILDLIIAGMLAVPAGIVTGVSAGISKIANPKIETMHNLTRIGQNCKEFPMYKLKTVTRCPDGERVLSSWSVLLRKHSIDELPQILNVLKGDMSFMGPRPLLYHDLFEESKTHGMEYIANRCALKPGFGFGYEPGRKTILPRVELEEQLFKDRGFKKYCETLWNLTKTVVKGTNK